MIICVFCYENISNCRNILCTNIRKKNYLTLLGKYYFKSTNTLWVYASSDTKERLVRKCARKGKRSRAEPNKTNNKRKRKKNKTIQKQIKQNKM